METPESMLITLDGKYSAPHLVIQQNTAVFHGLCNTVIIQSKIQCPLRSRNVLQGWDLCAQRVGVVAPLHLLALQDVAHRHQTRRPCARRESLRGIRRLRNPGVRRRCVPVGHPTRVGEAVSGNARPPMRASRRGGYFIIL